jgi:hypothetical protein
MKRTQIFGYYCLSFIALCLVLIDNTRAAPPNKNSGAGTPTQNWDQNFPSASRYTVLNDFISSAGVAGAAVRDNNTGLVWDQFPDNFDHTWASALLFCLNKKDRGPVGWRLPSLVELRSVQDPTLPAPHVPLGIFTNVASAYWSATSSAAIPGNAWFVEFGSGGPARNVDKNSVFAAWCVRGPMNVDMY